MPAPLRTRLYSFLSRQMYVERPEGSPNRVVIRHHSVEGVGTREVGTFPIESRLGRQELEALSDEILLQAQSDADGMGRRIQRYGIYVYISAQTSPVASTTLMFQGEGMEEGGDEPLDTEPANSKGLLSQLMRHNEANARTSTLAMGAVVKEQARIIERLTQQNEVLQGKVLAAVELTEELQSAKHERDMAWKQLEKRQQLTGELFEKIQILLPVVANKVLGKPVFPEAIDPRVMVVKEWAESLSTSQVDSLRRILKPEQVIALLDAMQATQEDKIERPIAKIRSITDGREEPPPAETKPEAKGKR
jgi:hypothetical protein